MKTFAALLMVALLMIVAVQGLSAQSAEKPHGAPAPPVRPSPPVRQTQHAARPSVPPPVAPRSPFDARPSTYAPRYTSPWPDGPRPFPGLYPFSSGFGFGYGYSAPDSGGSASPDRDPRELSSGLRDNNGLIYLDVEPRTAQVFVDGFYMGTVDDFSRIGLMLPAGRHWIDLRASGHETLTIPANIAAGQPTRYRGELIAVRTPVASAVPARGPQTMYVIPGCYAGDKPPQESSLSRGCDIARLHVLTNPR